MFTGLSENENNTQIIIPNGAIYFDDDETKPIMSSPKPPPQTKFNLSLNHYYHQITIASLTCLSTCLDGYMLIFIGYNNSILNRKWNLSQSHLLFLEIVYHITSALGGILSIPTCYFSNQIGMNYNFVFGLTAIPIAFLLFNTESYFFYLITIWYVCLAN